MISLSPSDRLLETVVRMANHGRTIEWLMYATGVDNATLTRSLNKLIRSGLVASRLVDGQTLYLAPRLENVPVRSDCASWVAQFLTGNLERQPEDHLGRIYSSVLEVLITALATGSRDPETISAYAALPCEFVATVLELAQQCDIWIMDIARQSEAAIRSEEPTSEPVIEAAQSLAETMWNLSWTDGMSSLLGRRLWGPEYVYDDDDLIVSYDSPLT